MFSIEIYEFLEKLSKEHLWTAAFFIDSFIQIIYEQVMNN